MSEPEGFLSRWTRLKREGGEPPEPGRDVPSDAASPDTARTAPAAEGEAPAEAVPAGAPGIDLSALPAIDSITAETDIRGFLAPGVPAELTRAALRRAWVADPKIRDFIGIAENQWDFTAADSIPGFGPLSPLDDVRRMVARVMGEEPEEPPASPVVASAENAPAVTVGGETPASASAEMRATRSEAAAEPSAPTPLPADQGDVGEATGAAHNDDPESSASDVPHPRSHGGALPKLFTGN
jgi:hypothetical protein